MDSEEDEYVDDDQHQQSRNWLKPTTAGIDRLDQVKTNVYNLGFVDAKQLNNAKNAARGPGNKTEAVTSHKPPTSRKEAPKTEPPMAKLTMQTAWGSNPSIPGLLQQHADRQRSRPESAKVTRATRPRSGRPQRPHSAKVNQPQRPHGVKVPQPQRPHSAKVTQPQPEEKDQSPTNKLGGIRGARYDQTERPDGVSVNLPGFGWVSSGAVPGGPNDLSQRDIDLTLQEVLNGQTSHQDTMYDSDAGPPPPRGSPDFLHMINAQQPMDDSSFGLVVEDLLEESQEKPASKPQPIRMPMAVDENDDEIRFSFETESPKHPAKKNKKLSMQNWKPLSEDHMSSIMNLESPKTLIADYADAEKQVKDDEEALFAYPKKVEVNLIIENKGDIAPKDSTYDLGLKGHPNVQFDEDKNITFDITPRPKKTRPASAKTATYSGRSDLRHVKSRVDSGVSLTSCATSARKAHTSRDTAAKTVSDMSVQGHQKSSKPTVSTIVVNYDEDDAEPNQSGMKGTKRGDVDTMVSSLRLSDGDLSDGFTTDEDMKTKTVSKPEQNYFEMSQLSTRRKTSESDPEDGKTRIKTIKTLELTSTGLVKETVDVSAIDVVEQRTRKEYVVPKTHRPQSAVKTNSRPGSAKRPDLKDNSENRPSSRLGFHGDTATQDNSANTLFMRGRAQSAHIYGSRDPTGRKISDQIKRNRDRPPSAQACGCKRGETKPPKAQPASNSKSSASQKSPANAMKPETEPAKKFTLKSREDKDRKKTMEKNPDHPNLIEIWTRKDDFEIETEGLKECKELQMKLLDAGVPVTLESLKRGLLPPTEYNFSGPTYKSTVHPPLTPNYTNSLLSNPKSTWLSDESKRVTEAKRRVREATRALEEQRLEEARLALAAETKTQRRRSRRNRSGKRRGKTCN